MAVPSSSAETARPTRANEEASVKIVLGILLVILVLLQVRLWTGTGGIAEIARLDTRIELQTEENADLTVRNQALMDEVSDLKNGLDSIEERARSELGLIRKGETFYLLVDDAPVREQPQASFVLPPEEFVPELLPSFSPVVEAALSPPLQQTPDVEAAGDLDAVEEAAELNPYLELFRDEDARAPAAVPGQ